MMLEAVFSAVLAGLEALLEDEDLEDEDEQRNKWKMKIVKDWTEEALEINLVGKEKMEALLEDEDLEDEDEQRNKRKKMIMRVEKEHMFNRVGQKRIMRKKMESEIIRLEALLEDEDLEDEDEQRNKWKMSSDQFDDQDGQGLDVKFHHSQLVVSVCFSITNSLEQRNKMKMNNGTLLVQRKMEVGKDWTEEEFEDEDEDEDITKDIIDFKLSIDQPKIIRMKKCIVDALAQECNHGKFSDVRRRHEDQFFALIGDTGFSSPPWIYDTGASFSLTEDLCIPLPPCHHPKGREHHRQHRPRAPSIQRLPRHHQVAHVWIYDTGASFSLTENLSLLHHRILPVLQHPPHAPQVHAHWIYDTEVSFSLTENLSQLQPEPQHHRQLPPLLPPVWIYDTGASFSLTGDLSLLPGVCSTGDCSPFLGLRHADPVSAANGQSVVSNKCGRASGTLNLSRTAPQTTGLISSSEPIAADNSSLLTPDTTPEQTWRVASAAPQHMTGYLNHLIDYTPASGDQVIDTPNMGPLAVHGRGSVNTANITLQDVLYVPCLDANLVSTGQLAQLGYMITLGPYGCRIYKDDEDMPLVGEAHYVDGYLLELDFLRVRPSTN